MSEVVSIRAEVGARLRSERHRLGLNQEAFARAADVSRRTQAGYEAGQGAPGADYLAALAGRGVDVLFVVTGQRAAAMAPGVEEGQPPAWSPLTSEEAQLLQDYRRADPADKAAVRRLLHSLQSGGPTE